VSSSKLSVRVVIIHDECHAVSRTYWAFQRTWPHFRFCFVEVIRCFFVINYVSCLSGFVLYSVWHLIGIVPNYWDKIRFKHGQIQTKNRVKFPIANISCTGNAWILLRKKREIYVQNIEQYLSSTKSTTRWICFTHICWRRQTIDWLKMEKGR
jgi:hypothetical protein